MERGTEYQKFSKRRIRCNPLRKRHVLNDYVKNRLSELILAVNNFQKFQCGKILPRKRQKYIMIVMEYGFTL